MRDAAGMELSDSQLCDLLVDALAPDDLSPSEEELAGLRAVLTARTTWSVGSRPLTVPAERLRGWIRRCRRSLVALGLIGGMVAGGAGAAFAAGASLPEPIRAIAYHLGLPVESPSLASTRHAVTDLRRDLGSVTADPARTQATVKAASALVSRLNRLDASDWQKAGPASLQLLGRARSFEAGRGLPLTAFPAHPAPSSDGWPYSGNPAAHPSGSAGSGGPSGSTQPQARGHRHQPPSPGGAGHPAGGQVSRTPSSGPGAGGAGR